MEIDLFNFGRPVGEAIGKLVPDGEYATITGKLGRGDAEAFAQSFKDGMKASGSKATDVADLAADWDRQKALDAATQIITAHPNVKAIYAANDDMAVGVSIAIDRTIWSYGLPFWIETDAPVPGFGAEPLRRLFVGQDTGSAILGAARADLFVGSGETAGDAAGSIRHPARFTVLLPRAS